MLHPSLLCPPLPQSAPPPPSSPPSWAAPQLTADGDESDHCTILMLITITDLLSELLDLFLSSGVGCLELLLFPHYLILLPHYLILLPHYLILLPHYLILLPHYLIPFSGQLLYLSYQLMLSLHNTNQ